MAVESMFQAELDRLAWLRDEGRKKAVRKALRAAGNLLKDAISEGAPVQAGEQRGEFKPGELKAGFVLSVQMSNDGIQKDQVTVRPKPYLAGLASMIENGHENRRGKKHGPQSKHGRTPAHPFVRPAWDTTHEAAAALFEETAAAEIEKDEHE